MTARLTPAEARRAGLTPPAKTRTTRRTEPRAGAVTVCTTCGESFRGETGEARHCAETRHARYEVPL